MQDHMPEIPQVYDQIEDFDQGAIVIFQGP